MTVEQLKTDHNPIYWLSLNKVYQFQVLNYIESAADSEEFYQCHYFLGLDSSYKRVNQNIYKERKNKHQNFTIGPPIAVCGCPAVTVK